MKWSGDVRRYIDPSVYRHLGYLRVNSFLCFFFFSRNRNRQIALKVQPLGGAAWVVPVVPEPGWIQGLCQEGRLLTKKPKQTSAVAPPAGSSRKDFVPELFSGFCVCLFSASHQSRYEKGCEFQQGVGRHWGGLNRTMEKCFQGDVEPAGQVPSTRQFNCSNQLCDWCNKHD